MERWLRCIASMLHHSPLQRLRVLMALMGLVRLNLWSPGIWQGGTSRGKKWGKGTVLSESWASHCVGKPGHTEMACVSSWMSGKETLTKKLYFHKEKDWLDTAVTAENLSYLFLMQVLQINWFSVVKLREARIEIEIGLFITTRIQQFEEK